MEIPEELKKYREMTDKEQQARCREIAEIIERTKGLWQHSS